MCDSELEAMQYALRRVSSEERMCNRSQRFARKPSPTRTFVEDVFAKRFKARKSSQDLLSEQISLVHSKLLVSPKDYYDHDEEIPGWWTWIGRLKKEIKQEQAFLEPTHKDYIRGHTNREKQLIAWEAELTSRQAKGAKALSLVLDFKATKYNRRRALHEDSLERLSDPSFPHELMTLIVESTVKSQLPYVVIGKSTSLSKIAEKVFARWPDTLGTDMRNALLQLAVRAILEHSIVKLPARFIFRSSLATPSTLQFRAHAIRHLALDLYAGSHFSARKVKLLKATEVIASIAHVFPRLESCVVLLRLVHDRNYRRLRCRGQFHSYEARLAAFLNIQDEFNNMRPGCFYARLFINFIAAFLEHGPGKRKFIQFQHERVRSAPKFAGPLVLINGGNSTSNEALPMQVSAVESDQFKVDAQNAFEKAYWGKGGSSEKLMTAYRELER